MGDTIKRFSVWLALVAVAAVLAVSPNAHADELSDVQSQLDSKVADLQKITERVDASGSEVAKLEDKIDELTGDIDKRQAKRAKLQQRIITVSRAIYKSGTELNIATIVTNSESLSDMFDRMEMRRKVLSEYAELADAQERVAAELQVSYQEVSAQKDKQAKKLAELRSEQKELDEAVSTLQARADELTAAQQAALAAAAEAEARAQEAQAAAAPEPATTEEESTESKKDDSSEKDDSEEKAEEQTEAVEETSSDAGWQTGLASAYGGSSDDSVTVNDPTATGAYVDDWSMGVAVPLAWGPSAYYGRSVEISYGGVTVVATVNDCGGMNGGSRALDLQPGVFRAFGFSTCDDWGVREVQYRFL